MTPRSITILGCTGTIGVNTLKIIADHADRFSVAALVAGDNVELLIQQAKTFMPMRAVVANPEHYQRLKEGLVGLSIEVAAGEEAVIDAAAMPSDMVMSAIVGVAGLRPTMAAVRRGARVALANKECLVSAGELMMQEVAAHGALLLPVDSEHNALFQLFDASQRGAIEQVSLTASGGPFRQWTREQMQSVTPAQAVKHPNWNMGAKISVDSATLMNKALELIEAHHLFGLPPEKLSVLIHPQSMVHCLIQMVDGSLLAQLSHPDMRTPIAYALAWPERIHVPVPRLSLGEIGQLQFEPPDEQRFPALRLAREVMRAGGNAAVVMNAANEMAVQQFLAGKIGFLDIVSQVEHLLQRMDNQPLHSIEDVLECDRETRNMMEPVC